MEIQMDKITEHEMDTVVISGLSAHSGYSEAFQGLWICGFRL